MLDNNSFHDYTLNMKDENKKSIYLQSKIKEEMESESRRTGRSVSWLINRSWKISREKIKQLSDE